MAANTIIQAINQSNQTHPNTIPLTKRQLQPLPPFLHIFQLCDTFLLQPFHDTSQKCYVGIVGGPGMYSYVNGAEGGEKDGEECGWEGGESLEECWWWLIFVICWLLF